MSGIGTTGTCTTTSTCTCTKAVQLYNCQTNRHTYNCIFIMSTLIMSTRPFPYRVTVARVETARRLAVQDLAVAGHQWTQEDQDHFDTVVRPAVMTSVWESTADMGHYIFAMHMPRPDDVDPPSSPDYYHGYDDDDQGCPTCQDMGIPDGSCPYCCDDCHGI